MTGRCLPSIPDPVALRLTITHGSPLEPRTIETAGWLRRERRQKTPWNCCWPTRTFACRLRNRLIAIISLIAVRGSVGTIHLRMGQRC